MFFLGGWRKKCIFFNCDISDLCHNKNLGPNPDPGSKNSGSGSNEFRSNTGKLRPGENKSSFQKSIAECGFI
jgi:hypothetical protein